MARRCARTVLDGGDAGHQSGKLQVRRMSLMIQFLERDPNKRLGYRPGGGGMADIKSHPWFRGIDWQAVYNKEVVPPFEPDVST